jgi:hypothetical protein
MIKRTLMLATALMLASTFALASKPTKITFSSEGATEEGEAFATYIVKCRNGKVIPITAWDNRHQWCVGEESRELCNNKQIKTAKAACKI